MAGDTNRTEEIETDSGSQGEKKGGTNSARKHRE